jgi:glucose-6-phosphate 1-dehydrogenase
MTRIETVLNPLRDPRDKRLPRVAGPCVLVLFGVTGDLARKKLLPAIYDLANRGLLPPGFAVVGFARRDWEHQDFRQLAHDAVKEHARTPFREEVWNQLSEGIHFVPGTFDDDEAFERLATTWTKSAAPAATTRSTCRSRRSSSRTSSSSCSAAGCRSRRRTPGGA